MGEGFIQHVVMGPLIIPKTTSMTFSRTAGTFCSLRLHQSSPEKAMSLPLGQGLWNQYPQTQNGIQFAKAAYVGTGMEYKLRLDC